MRQRPSIRTKYRIDPPPKDGSNIEVPVTLLLKVYWDGERKQWVLERPLRIETLTLDRVTRWRRP